MIKTKAKFLAEKFSQKFGVKIPRRTVSDILKNKESLKRKAITRPNSSKRNNKVLYPEIEEKI